jgi:glycosyltransferase involved in cell wall biosynthesis
MAAISSTPLCAHPKLCTLRIAQLITGSDSLGGAQTHVRDLVSELRSCGHECTVLVGPPDGAFCKQLRESGVQVRMITSLHKALAPWRDARALAEVWWELRRLKPDLVAVHTAKASFLGRVAASCLRIPCVFTPHGCSVIDRKTGEMRRLFLILERIAGRFGGKVITVSEAERRLADFSGIVASHNLVTIHNGIPDSGQLADPGRQPAKITMVARFDPPKDQETLLRALAEIQSSSWTLQLAGAGTLLPESKRLAQDLHIADRVEFLGEFRDIPRLLSESQMFVLSSRLEAFPISILEAMRSGLPVVASDVGGISEAVRDGETGFLVPARDHIALAARLHCCISDPPLRLHLGNNGRRRYLAHFTAESMARKTLAVYAAAVSHKSSRSVRFGFRRPGPRGREQLIVYPGATPK